MKIKITVFTFIVLSGFHLTAYTAPADEAPADMIQISKNSFICTFNNNVLPDVVPTFVQEIVAQNGALVRHKFKTVIKGFSAMMSKVAAENLQVQNPNIEYCVPNTLVTVGGKEVAAGGKGGAGGKPGQVEPQVIPEGIIRVGGPIDGLGLTAWILDSGIDLDHLDLNVDVSRGKDTVSSVAKGKTTFDDVHGHGTHVAGILAAIDNDRDVVGVAAGATVVPVRILAASNFGYADDVIAGMDYVASHESTTSLDVVNMSIWGWDHNRAMHDAAHNLADIVPVVTISGNGGADINAEPTEPGHVEHTNLYTVSAVYHNDEFTSFSNWGFSDDWAEAGCSVNYPDDPYPCATVDFSAPGHDVLSLKPGGGLASWWGTSMAAPHVAAIVLLLQKRVIKPDSDGDAIGDPDSSPDPIVHY